MRKSGPTPWIAGNTTAATGKGFAIGSAALTGLALLASYMEEVRIGMVRLGENLMTLSAETVEVAKASLVDFMDYYQVTLMNPKVLAGIFYRLDDGVPLLRSHDECVGRAAQRWLTRYGRQFREIKGILTGEATPDYERCVEISPGCSA